MFAKSCGLPFPSQLPILFLGAPSVIQLPMLFLGAPSVTAIKKFQNSVLVFGGVIDSRTVLVLLADSTGNLILIMKVPKP